MSGYKLSVPIMSGTFEKYGRENTLKLLKDVKAERVFLATPPFIVDDALREKFVSQTALNVEYLKENGFEVGIWTWASYVTGENRFQNQINFKGENVGIPCFEDPSFVAFAAKCVSELAKTNPDLIMLDDDLRFFESPGCVCQLHLKRLSESIGEEVTLDNFKRLFLQSEENGEIFRMVMGKSIENYVERLGEAVRAVNPEIRFGFCAIASTWGIDGTDVFNMTRLMSGKTKPFIRFIGAPYWSAHQVYDLATVIETMRNQASWCKDSGIETMAEGDVYPRPRFNVPAALAELFDIAARADGNADGILKYMFDYSSSPSYETGYIQRHLKHADIYKAVEDGFSDKRAVGVRIRKHLLDLAKSQYSTKYEENNGHRLLFPAAGETLAAMSIPTSYETEGFVEAVFGDDALYVDSETFKKGCLIDIPAALILQTRGIDVGLYKITGKKTCQAEHFPDGETAYIDRLPFYAAEVSEQAEVLSCYSEKRPYYEITGKEDPPEYPAAYIYENAEKMKFLVFAFDGVECGREICRVYPKSKQVTEAIEKIGGKKLPAVCYGNPYLYMMCKESGGELAAGLWNIFADSVEEPLVMLDGEYRIIKEINTRADINKNALKLSRMEPYSFAGVILKRVNYECDD